MPRTTVVDAPPDPPIRQQALIASAARLPPVTDLRIYTGAKDWQTEAYRQYDICGELRFAANWIANALSRSSLMAARRGPGGVLVGLPSKEASAAMAALFAGSDGQAQMLHALGLHLTLAGEAYIIGRRTIDEYSEQPVERWEVLSVGQVVNRGKRWTIDYGYGKPVELGDDDAIIRIWRPHPARHIEADSPVRALLPVLKELEWLTRRVWAEITSRLTGAGVLMLSQNITFPSRPDSPGGNEAEEFLAVLIEAAGAAIADPGSPASLVPIVVTVPDEVMGRAAEQVKFWSELDSQAGAMRNECIRRIAIGLDIPAEEVLGMGGGGISGGANHWSAWMIEEAAIKIHLEPLLQVICDALTEKYLIPLTEDPQDCVVFDTAAIRLRPDRSKEAFELFDRGEINGEALRRETGMNEDDDPGEDERKVWLLRKVASGSASPEQVQAALDALGVHLGGPQGSGANEARPSPTLDKHPRRDIPVRRNARDEALVAAADVLCLRAFERAGNRARSKAGGVKLAVPSHQTHTVMAAAPCDVEALMENAFASALGVLDPLTEEPEAIIARLDGYCRTSLVCGIAHDRERMAVLL